MKENRSDSLNTELVTTSPSPSPILFYIGLNFIVHTTEIPHFVEGNSAFRLLTGNATSNFQHHQTTIGGVKLHLFTILRAENDHQTLRLTLALCDV